MRSWSVFWGLTLALAACSEPIVEAPVHPSEEVDVFVGTGGLGFGVGSMIPGPQLPFGMARPSPDTSTRGGAPGFSHCAGYWYEDTEIEAFSQLHLVGTGVPDLGVIALMPALDLPADRIRPADYRADLDHRLEAASVGAYRVRLAPSNIEVRIGATPRTALYRISYPESGQAQLVLDLAHGLGSGETLDSELTVDGAEVRGWLEHKGNMSGGYGGFKAYFVMRLARAPLSATLLEAGLPQAGVTSGRGPAVGVLLDFGEGAAPVDLQIGLSFVDVEAATANLDAEWANFDLDGAQAKAVLAWDQVLRRLLIEGGDATERKKLYTALYHVHAMPTDLTEAGGRYRGIDGQVRVAEGYTYYSDFSLWDTFRTLHPLMSLLEKERQRDFNRSLEAMADASGRIPKWPLATGETNTMIGYHAETVLADSYQRGVEGFEVERSYQRLRRAAVPVAERDQESLRQRDCAQSYLERGFCAADLENSSVSKTLENAFSDHVLSRLASSLGHAEDAARFEARAQGYRAVVDPELGLVQGKNSDGSFVRVSPELFGDDFVEGNAWQWTSFVPHDVPGLAEALGGRDRLVAYLDQFFQGTADTEDGPLPDVYYWHGNEPDLHAAYLYAEVGEGDRMAQWVDWIRRTRYSDRPEGLDGNDDGGTLSAWLVLSSLGLYPKIGEPRWILGTPAFPQATLDLGEGVLLTIVAENWRPGAYLVDEVRFDGATLEGPFIDHQRLASGGTLTFVMRP